MSTYICKRHLLDSDLKRGPGKEPKMIKCVTFLIDQILNTKMQMALIKATERGGNTGKLERRAEEKAAG